MTAAALVLAGGLLPADVLPGPTVTPTTEGSPGFIGFVVTFLLAVAVIGLGISMSRRMRRSQHRWQLRDQGAGDETAADGRPGTDATPADDAPDGAAHGDGHGTA